MPSSGGLRVMNLAIEANLVAGEKEPTGLGVYVDSLLSSFARNGEWTAAHTFYLLHARQEWRGKDYGRRFVPVSYRMTRSQFAGIAFHLNHTLNALHADLFHATCTAGLPPRLSIPGVVTVHDLFQLTSPDVPLRTRLLMRLLFRWTRRNAACFICNSAFTRHELTRFGIPEAKTAVVLLGSRFAFSPQEAHRVSSPRRAYFLCVGAIEPRKGQLMLCRAYCKALAENPELPDLIFAGPDRGDAHTLREMAAAQPKIRYLGFVGDEELADLYRGASLFVFPSFAEGFGIPVAEAANAGLPVLCSDIPVLREIADGFAKFAAPDEDAFAEALLAFPRSRNERKSAAHFSWDACARETMRIYQTVLEKAGK